MNRLRACVEKIRARRGFALFSAMVMLTVILAFSVTLINYLLSTRRTAKSFETAVYATQLAEAGLDKAIHCLNATSGAKCGGTYGMNYTGETDVAFGQGKFSTIVAGGATAKTVTTTGLAPGGIKKVYRTVVTTIPVSASTIFDYIMQADDGGILVDNLATVEGGDYYSNSNVICGKNTELSGDVYVSLVGGKIENCTIVGDAHADNFEAAEVTGDAYYRLTFNKSAAANAYQVSTTPERKSMPSLDLDFWHRAAEIGGTTYGDLTPADGSHLGPGKIVGDLTLAQNMTVTLDGPVWVVGDIVLENNAHIALNPAYGVYSTVLLADDPDHRDTAGKIDVSPNATIDGSGNLKSFVLVVSTNTSTNDDDPAIDLYNNAGGSIFYGMFGGVRIHNNASATAIAGKRAVVNENGLLDYDPLYHDISDLNMATEIPGYWRTEAGAWLEIAN